MLFCEHDGLEPLLVIRYVGILPLGLRYQEIRYYCAENITGEENP